MIFKPKSLKVYVPNHGVIDKADFSEIHLKACLKQIKEAGLDKDEYLKKRFDVVSYDNLPLFEEDAEEKAKLKSAEESAIAEQKAKDEAEAKRIAEEAELQAAIDAEEKAKSDAKGE